MPLTDDDFKSLDGELQQIKSAHYVESSEQVAGWNFVQSPHGRGFLFHELPESDRQVLVEDYVDWDRYRELGLTWEDQTRIMVEAAADPLPRMPEMEPHLAEDAVKAIHAEVEEPRFPKVRAKLMADPGLVAKFPEPAFRERFIRRGFDRSRDREFAEIAERPGDPLRNLVTEYYIRAAEVQLANDNHPQEVDPPPSSPSTPEIDERNAYKDEQNIMNVPDAARETLPRVDPLELARRWAREAAKEPDRGKDGPEIG